MRADVFKNLKKYKLVINEYDFIYKTFKNDIS